MKSFKEYKKKYVTPEKMMRRYPEDIQKTPWVEFAIVVPTQEDADQIRSAMHYMHNLREIDTDFVPVNQLVHEYEHEDESDKHTRIVVDPELFKKIKNEKLR